MKLEEEITVLNDTTGPILIIPDDTANSMEKEGVY